MYKKLNISLAELDIDKLKGTTLFNNPTFKEYFINDRQYFFNVLNSKIQFKIPPVTANITEISYPGSNPHTDTWPTAMNFYFDAGDDETCFWKNINTNIKTTKGLSKFNIADLEKTDSFVAQKGDCYLLDVSSIHSVKMKTPDTKRKMIRLVWFQLSFDQVLQSLKFL